MKYLGIFLGTLTSLAWAGCGDNKDPLSANKEGAPSVSGVSNHMPVAYEAWVKDPSGADLDGDGGIDEVDYAVFLSQLSEHTANPKTATTGAADQPLTQFAPVPEGEVTLSAPLPETTVPQADHLPEDEVTLVAPLPEGEANQIASMPHN